MTDVKSGSFKKDKVDIEVKRLDVSRFPDPGGQRLAHAARVWPTAWSAISNKFPYLCTEQLVSRAFPAVVLKTRPEFGYTHKKAAENIDQTISVLRARQNAEGAFGFWAANSHTSEYASVYALHFLTEAKERGFTVPQEPVNRGMRDIFRSMAMAGSDSLAKARTGAYAIYVLTRNGVVTTNYIDAMREQLDKNKADEEVEKGHYRVLSCGDLQAAEAGHKADGPDRTAAHGKMAEAGLRQLLRRPGP